MNNLDALYNLYMSALDDFPHGIKFDPDLNETIWYKQIKESLENNEHYRWHDLRKDSNDLPKEDGYYWVYFICYSQLQRKSVESYDKALFRNGKFISIGKIVAWKYMEEFSDELPKVFTIHPTEN